MRHLRYENVFSDLGCSSNWNGIQASAAAMAKTVKYRTFTRGVMTLDAFLRS